MPLGTALKTNENRLPRPTSRGFFVPDCTVPVGQLDRALNLR